ncbi:MAG: hypothetical protein K6T80_07415 [Firmicutes bacterium]|nr:hypothetical protein [Bacillota bacterium]
MSQAVIPVLMLAVVAFLCNIPLGFWRASTRKFSWRWFLAVHLSIPLIFALRLKLGISGWFIPLSLGAAVTGQLVGGRFDFGRVHLFRHRS